MASIQFGVLAFNYQVVDAAGPTDILAAADRRALKHITKYVPISEELISRAPEFEFHHIGVTKEPVKLGTSNMIILPTTTADECPELDILLVSGPPLGGFILDPKFVALIRKHNAAGKLIFTNCTGASLVASTGVLDGRKATVNKVEYEWVKKQWPKVDWIREKTWIADGNIWTGSGAVAGTDMVSHWLKENYGLGVLLQAAATLDYEPRDDDGLYNVFPQRYNSKGEKISSHVFRYYEE
ncbi:ThiJ/PfpI family protein [Fusarium austroafricanum]|uniref:ThiJ/PfpI family protein n=1 Tax=Fusarium austroafricanum TaxID=2364996 RepID=A0A8H4JA43_9HYPO|nr:ThiJ/PfpI family protein [Fusarium austroafricanum]